MQVETKSLIVLVGHCGPDNWALRSAVSRAVPGAVLVSADDGEALAEQASQADLLLVNRVLDGSFETASGIELISKLSASGMRCMLISNFADAQADAEAAGAVPGFGKAQMNSPDAVQKLRDALGIAQG